MINPTDLPKVDLADIEYLPKMPGYYFVLENNQVIYIGKADSARGIWARWHNGYHHKHRILQTLDNIQVAYWCCLPVRAKIKPVEDFEKFLIWHYKPKLNKISPRWEGIYKELLKIPTLWTPSYFVSTAGNICTETVKRYIEQQRD